MKVEELRDRLAEALADQGQKHPYTMANYIIRSRGKGAAEEMLRELLPDGAEDEAA